MNEKVLIVIDGKDDEVDVSTFVRTIQSTPAALKVPQRVAASAASLRSPETHEAETELEGLLDRISIHKEAKMGLYDPLSDKAADCYFNKDDAEKLGAQLDHRIRVSGVATYFQDFTWPRSIKVTSWEAIDERDLPSLEMIHNSGVKLIKDERPSEDIINEMREMDA